MTPEERDRQLLVAVLSRVTNDLCQALRELQAELALFEVQAVMFADTLKEENDTCGDT